MSESAKVQMISIREDFGWCQNIYKFIRDPNGIGNGKRFRSNILEGIHINLI